MQSGGAGHSRPQYHDIVDYLELDTSERKSALLALKNGSITFWPHRGYEYPTTVVGGNEDKGLKPKNLSVQDAWRYPKALGGEPSPFLAYSKRADAIFCSFCALSLPAHTAAKPGRAKSGTSSTPIYNFRKWQNFTRAYPRHVKSAQHGGCVEVYTGSQQPVDQLIVNVSNAEVVKKPYHQGNS